MSPRIFPPKNYPMMTSSGDGRKSNPFGAAKPRDESEFLRKKEEERKARGQTDSREDKPQGEESDDGEFKPRRGDQKLYQARGIFGGKILAGIGTDEDRTRWT